LKTYFGDEYPAAICFNGARMPLASEDRWTRYFASEDRMVWHHVSRFMDGSATITFPELVTEWPTWSDADRLDFCGSCSWLGEQPDFPEMLRFIMEHGSPRDWSTIANSVAVRLPQNEAFDILVRALRSSELNEGTNLSQGISLTKHPHAESMLREHLDAIWSHPAIWKGDDFLNWVAYGATCCIQHLIAVGAPAEDFTEKVKGLAEHACAGNRDACGRFLAKHYSWLDEPLPPPWVLPK
jgi:hypothetical protein